MLPEWKHVGVDEISNSAVSRTVQRPGAGSMTPGRDGSRPGWGHASLSQILEDWLRPSRHSST